MQKLLNLRNINRFPSQAAITNPFFLRPANKHNYLFSSNNQAPIEPTPPKSFFSSPVFLKYFGPKTYIASPRFKNRWLMVLPCVLSNLCIGSPYAWSLVAGLIYIIIFLKNN